MNASQEMQRLRRVAGAAVMQWADEGAMQSQARHALRVSRLKATWPGLASALEHLADACAATPLDVMEASDHRCPNCHSPVTRLIIGPDPRTAAPRHLVQPCGHVLDRDQSLSLWERGLPTDVTKISATALVAAEQIRQREEEGHSLESDAEHEPGALSWAAWCLLDRATSPRDFNGEVPTMWPLPPERWKPEGKSALRLKIIAAAMICSDIDAALAAGETP